MLDFNRCEKVSVVMATYNGARFIEEQLDSLNEQTCLPHELIVSDDGSIDETLDIVARFRERARFPVEIVKNRERLGYGGNFLQATRKASGEYISFCDQDDIWLPNKLEYSLKALQKDEGDLFVHAANLVNADGAPIGKYTQNIKARRLYGPLELPPWGVFYGLTMLFHRRLFDLFDIDKRGAHTFEWQGELSHDLWIYFIYSSLGRVVVDPQTLINYRQHNLNQTPHILGTWWNSLSKLLGVSAHPRLRRDGIAAHRSALLSDLAERTTDEQLKLRASKAAEYWQQVSSIEAERIALYTQEQLRQRILYCARIASSGGYLSPEKGGLGRHLLVRDVLVGVLQVNRWRKHSHVQ